MKPADQLCEGLLGDVITNFEDLVGNPEDRFSRAAAHIKALYQKYCYCVLMFLTLTVACPIIVTLVEFCELKLQTYKLRKKNLSFSA